MLLELPGSKTTSVTDWRPLNVGMLTRENVTAEERALEEKYSARNPALPPQQIPFPDNPDAPFTLLTKILLSSAGSTTILEIDVP
jgi:hypothetical protein